MTTTPSPDLTVQLNGASRAVPAGTTVHDLLVLLDIDPAQGGIAVAVGMRVVPRGAWQQTTLSDGDAIELIRATAGG